MRTRLDFHEFLCELLGSRNVYFQVPPNLQMKYPAIKYSYNNIRNDHADNAPYIQSTEYMVTVIDPSPDSEIVEKFFKLSKCTFDRQYSSDNLNHFVFTIYY